MLRSKLMVEGRSYEYYSIKDYAEKEALDVSHLPFSLRILLENLIRHRGNSHVPAQAVRDLASWRPENIPVRDIAYHPARVVMQDFTGVPAVVDLASMRDALNQAGGDGKKINPIIPVDLVIDHSVMVDAFGSSNAFSQNTKREFERNRERYRFLKWGQQSFKNFRVVPPGTGIIHQVNLEYLAQVIQTCQEGEHWLAYPDTLVGTDSHTTMVNGLGILGWGVGGIEAEAAMLGQPVTMLIPEVIGVELRGKLAPGLTATDLVLAVVEKLRSYGVVGKFVEFFGSGLDHLSLADRATISNMAPEYGATCGIFPIDNELLLYLRLTGREESHIALVETYAKTQGLWRDDAHPASYSDVLVLDMDNVVPSMAGPRRPQDKVEVSKVPENFQQALKTYYGVSDTAVAVPVEGRDYKLSHGDVAIAAITSCTNTSNPVVLVTAGLLAKKAVEKGLRSRPWVKTSLAPGSQVVTAYLDKAGLSPYLEELGFYLVGYGCTTCIGNSGPLPKENREAILKGNLVTVNVLSGNRNFEGRISPDSKASYLASPPLVVAYALVGTVLKDLFNDSLGNDKEGNPVYLKDLWPQPEEVEAIVKSSISSTLFKDKYRDVFTGPKEWQELEAPQGEYYDWEENSTYIRKAPFFEDFAKGRSQTFENLRCLAILPDSTTTDHISPAGSIPSSGPAGTYLRAQGVEPREFNSFGSRRGNHEVMMRGTFANIRIRNKMLPGTEGGLSKAPDGSQSSIYDAAMAWNEAKVPLLVIAGKEYGTGSSRDWAAKGTLLLGVKAVLAESYERIHRSNLIGMGVLPLEFSPGESAESLSLKGDESFTLHGIDALSPRKKLKMTVRRMDGSDLEVLTLVRIDTANELNYWKSGGILSYVLRKLGNR